MLIGFFNLTVQSLSFEMTKLIESSTVSNKIESSARVPSGGSLATPTFELNFN